LAGCVSASGSKEYQTCLLLAIVADPVCMHLFIYIHLYTSWFVCLHGVLSADRPENNVYVCLSLQKNYKSSFLFSNAYAS